MAEGQRRVFNTGITRLWGVVAPLYEARHLQAWVYGPAHSEVLAVLRDRRPRRIADIGCGTGILASRIAHEPYAEAVYGVDMSEGMLNRAKAQTSEVRWLVAPAETPPFDDGALDAVVTTSAFHFFDQPVAMTGFHRVLAPGGVLAVATVSLPESHPLHDRSISRRHPVHNPSPSRMRELFEEAGFTVDEQHRVRRPRWTKFISDIVTVGSKA